MSAFPSLLELLLLVPAIGAVALFFVRRNGLAWGLGLGCALVELWLAVHLYQTFDLHDSSWQWYRRWFVTSWVVYTVGADGISVIFMLLTAFLSVLVAIYGGLVRCFTPLPRFLAVVLACEAVLMGQFATLDLLWFVLFSAVQILIVGYQFTTWSLSTLERLAISRYYQFMGTSILLLVLATLMLGWSHGELAGGAWSFELGILQADHRSLYIQEVVFFLLFYGLAIRVPIFPLHGWLPHVMEHGTVASALVLLVGLKTGVYGMVRFMFPLVPDAVWHWHVTVIAIAAVGIFYSALFALVQKNLRKLLAYAVISHTGILVIGLFSLHPQAFQGTILLTMTFGLAISTLLLMAGIVYLRTHTMVLVLLGGLFSALPWIGIAFLVAAFSVVGMPGTPGFEAVHLLLEAAIHRFGALVTVAAALGNVAAAACLLWAFQRAFLATPLQVGAGRGVVARATWVEQSLAILLLAVQLISGFYAEPWLSLVENGSKTLATPYMER
ncbi:MAG: NADH-quinone oxidoreductase subunit L [Magnetococcales bacterium]|nr:NADH-quinone oxidoreductase subunit L [Magnetococcales bacterium]MBF0437812.1 NADH-quinone oxidoreductase subunit L [Magnetococcales bacterium]